MREELGKPRLLSPVIDSCQPSPRGKFYENESWYCCARSSISPFYFSLSLVPTSCSCLALTHKPNIQMPDDREQPFFIFFIFFYFTYTCINMCILRVLVCVRVRVCMYICFSSVYSSFTLLVFNFSSLFKRASVKNREHCVDISVTRYWRIDRFLLYRLFSLSPL